MQRSIANDSSAPLNERFTLVLLSHEQPQALRRALRYYADYPCAQLVLDSSAEPDADSVAALSGVRYVHRAEAGHFANKLRQGLEHVKTPYLALIDVDAFLLPGALDQSLEFLAGHDDYSACQGYALTFEARASHVDYYRRDRKGVEDFVDPSAQERLAAYAGHCLSLINAVTRTEVVQRWYAALPADLDPAWQELGHGCALMAAAKVHVLPIPYGVHALESPATLEASQLAAVLSYRDAGTVALRERLVAALDSTFGLGQGTLSQAVESLEEMGNYLSQRAAFALAKLFEAAWHSQLQGPICRFEPTQFVELPFYNQPFFESLSKLEFLMHAIPAGRVQLKELEAVLLKQKELARPQRNTSAEPLNERLLKAFMLNAFNRDVVCSLATLLEEGGAQVEAERLSEWAQRLESVMLQDHSSLFETMRSGRLLRWLDGREPSTGQVQQISQYLAGHKGGPTFGILLLDLEADFTRLQATFDSVINGACRAFKIVVFTTGDLPAETTVHNTLHFVKVTESNYVDKINQVVGQIDCDWVVLAEAGDELTPSGLMHASLELLDAPQCRAVAMDEFQRQPDETLVDVFRPGFNLDLLLSVPSLMARHWLVRREVLVQAGGYSRDFKDALEFELLLRLIEQGGMGGLAHLDEALLVCQAVPEGDNADERKALLRHLAARGYKADVGSVVPGIYKIDYRFIERPLVSIILHGEGELVTLQRCIVNVLQRTRYQRFELLVAEHPVHGAALKDWLRSQGHQASRVRFIEVEPGLATATLINQASQQAKGEYLLTLAVDSEVVNVNWIELLLNHAQRPEVGVVGARLIDRQGKITQAGLILGLNGAVGSAFVGEPADARGYMNRLVAEQNCSAVSFTCLMISTQLFQALDGVDDTVFAEGLGDVDLCLRAAQAGYLTVWTPYVQVVNPGSLSSSPEARQALLGKWQEALAHDANYNGNLDLSGSGYTLGPVTQVPWSVLIGQAGA
ncbi:glycosyltransferase family 2 protein [Pseudomonas mediterranea]|uniref:glycosyltransferase family 2 protein n=1 Tax=Pseudomonas mediterranea TaxID=183795 RepID=UPI003BF5E2D5